MTVYKYPVEGLDTPLTQRAGGWADFRQWLDEFLAGKSSDSFYNLATSLSLSPSAGELAEIFEDGYGFLPGELAQRALIRWGLPDGIGSLGEAYPVVSLADAETNKVPAELIELAKKSTRRPLFVLTPAGWWACKAPGHTVASQYEDAMSLAFQGKGSRAQPLYNLTLACVLSPEKSTVEAQIEQYPAIPYLLGRALRSAAGEGKVGALVIT